MKEELNDTEQKIFRTNTKTEEFSTQLQDITTEIENIKRERDLMEEMGIPEFQAQPFSPKPDVPGQPKTDQPVIKPEVKYIFLLEILTSDRVDSGGFEPPVSACF